MLYKGKFVFLQHLRILETNSRIKKGFFTFRLTLVHTYGAIKYGTNFDIDFSWVIHRRERSRALILSQKSSKDTAIHLEIFNSNISNASKQIAASLTAWKPSIDYRVIFLSRDK